MSRSFDPAAGTDSITFSVGAAPPDQGPITVAVLAKATSTTGWTGWMVRGLKSGTAIWGFLTSNNAGAKLFAENDFGNGVAGLSTGWRWYVMTKASGSALPRMHVWDLSGAWSHTDNSANVGDGTGPIDTLVVGSNGSGSNGWRGSIAVVAAWTSVLSDVAIESAMTLAARDTFNASPGWMIRLNQASTATSITDDTGGGGNQSAISGTTVDADDPPGYSYSLTSTDSASAALTVTATLSSFGTDTITPAAALAATVTLSAAASRTAIAAAALAVAASLAVDGPLTKPVGAGLGVTVGLSAMATGSGSVGAALTATATLTAAAVNFQPGAARTPTVTVDLARVVAIADLTRPTVTVAL